MIDRKSRDLLAEKLRQFVSGLLSNDEFEREIEDVSDEDAAIGAIVQYA